MDLVAAAELVSESMCQVMLLHDVQVRATVQTIKTLSHIHIHTQNAYFNISPAQSSEKICINISSPGHNKAAGEIVFALTTLPSRWSTRPPPVQCHQPRCQCRCAKSGTSSLPHEPSPRHKRF